MFKLIERFQAPRGAAMLLCGVVLAFAAAGCGGASKSKLSTTPTTQRTATTSPSPTGASTVTTGPVRGTLTAPDHAPVAGKLWPYMVKVTDASGKPLPGTVDTEFAFAGQVVGRESPPTHPLVNGALSDMVTWPPQSVGQPLVLQTVVHTSLGSITLDWPVTPRR
jgi:hypothetical protein